jgi:hypothetical protein
MLFSYGNLAHIRSLASVSVGIFGDFLTFEDQHNYMLLFLPKEA